MRRERESMSFFFERASRPTHQKNWEGAHTPLLMPISTHVGRLQGPAQCLDDLVLVGDLADVFGAAVSKGDGERGERA